MCGRPSSLLVDGFLAEHLDVGLAVGVDDAHLLGLQRERESRGGNEGGLSEVAGVEALTLGCMSSIGSSATTSPPRAPRYSLTLTE